MKFNFATVSKFAATGILAASVAPAMAQSAGDTVFSAGWFHVAPQDSSTPLTVTSPAPVAGPQAGTGASVGKVNTLGLSIDHYFTDNLSASFDFGIPPKYKLTATGTLAAGMTAYGVSTQIGTAKQWAPALVGKYHFFDAQSAFRPMIGLGVTRVSYKDIQLDSGFQSFSQHSAGSSAPATTGTTTASLGSKWAPVFTAGMSYAITKDLYAAFSVSYIPLKTTANVTTTTTSGPLSSIGPVQSTATLTLNPIVTYLSLGYRF